MRVKGVHPRIRELADQFWKPIIELRSFPVDIERAIAWSNLPVHIDLIPGLDIARVEEWIQQYHVPARLNKENCELHGFLLAYRRHGVIFVNGADPVEERRFTIAHELAHFLMDYQAPRSKYLELHGESIMEVLDGERPATVEERLRFILSELPSPFFTHTLDRIGITAYAHKSVWKIEWRADALAVELLAPFQVVAARLKKNGLRKDFQSVFRDAASLLVVDFGLPAGISTSYARHIAKSITDGPTLAEEWGIR